MQIYAEMAWLDGRTLSRNVLVSVDDGIISDIRRSVPRPEVSGAGLREAQLLLPGFINAHCHLEYSHLAGQMNRNPPSFASWLNQMIASGSTPQDGGRKNSAMEKAAENLRAGGCTTVFDCSTDGASETFLANAELRHVLLFECLGLTRERAEPLLNRALELLREPGGSLCVGRGLAPHSPYSVGSWLLGALRSLAAGDAGIAMAWHLAESREELEYLQKAAGPIAELLAGFGFPLAEQNAASAWDFLIQNGLAESCVHAIHGNLFAPAEAAHFHAPKAVVYCPSTNEWFGRRRVAVPAMLAEGTNVCLGTDSLASSETLDMLQLLRITAGQYPELTGPQLINISTLNAGRSWPLSEQKNTIGIIARNAVADFAALATVVPHTSLRDMLTHNQTRVDWTMVAGQIEKY